MKVTETTPPPVKPARTFMLEISEVEAKVIRFAVDHAPFAATASACGLAPSEGNATICQIAGALDRALK